MVNPPGGRGRVIFLSPFNQAISGPDENLRLLIPQLQARGWEVQVAVPGQGPSRQRFLRLGVTVHDLPLDRLRRTFNPWQLSLYPIRLARCCAALKRRLQAEKIDIVCNNMESTLSGSLCGRRLGLPVVTVFNGCLSQRPRWLLRPLFSRLRRLCTAALTPSPLAAEQFAALGLAGELTLLPNPIDCSSPPRRGGGSTGATVVGYAGRFHPSKNLPLLLQAVREVAEHGLAIKLRLMGEAAIPEEQREERRLRQLVDRAGLSEVVEFHPAAETISNFLNTLDIFALPSRRESFGRVLFEAIAAGAVPLISSAVAGRHWLGRAAQPYVFQSENTASCRDRLQWLIATLPQRRQEVEMVLRPEICAAAGTPAVAAAWDNLLTELLRKKQDSRS